MQLEQLVKSVSIKVGLNNKASLVRDLAIATLNDYHRSRVWSQDTHMAGWSKEEEDVKAREKGCGPSPIVKELVVPFEIGSTPLKVNACDLLGEDISYSTFERANLTGVCKPEENEKPFSMSYTGGSVVLTSKVGFKLMTIAYQSTPTYDEASFESSWISELYPNTIVYSVCGDILSDIGAHNATEWQAKARHALAHMQATEHYWR